MNAQTHRIFKDLLSLHGHVTEPDVAPIEQSATEESAMNLFKSLWLLGGLQSVDTRVGEDEDPAFGQTYGNRIASERSFGKPRIEAQREARARQPIVAQDQRIAHC